MRMQEKRPKYVLAYLIAMIIGLLGLSAGYAVFVMAAAHSAALLAASLCFLGVLGLAGWSTARIYGRYFRQSEQVLKLYAAGYTIEEICRLDWYASRGTEMALKKAMEMLDTGTLLKASKKQAQYLALQNQINPHFLYNTLEGIRSEAVIAGLDVVADMTEALARFFRYTISKVENLVTLEEELGNIRTYFSIQQFRFGERLHLKIEYPQEETDILKCRLPKLTLQPIVENAIIHGLEQKVEDGELRILIHRTEKRLIVQLSDNGIGIEKEVLMRLQDALAKTTYASVDSRREGGIALLNVNNRIRLLFGEEYGLVIHSVRNCGTDVTVTLPVDQKGEERKQEHERRNLAHG